MNGQEATSDAHTVADYWGGNYTTWATLWLVFALVCSAVGLLLAFDGHTYKQQHKTPGDVESQGGNVMLTPTAPPPPTAPVRREGLAVEIY